MKDFTWPHFPSLKVIFILSEIKNIIISSLQHQTVINDPSETERQGLQLYLSFFWKTSLLLHVQILISYLVWISKFYSSFVSKIAFLCQLLLAIQNLLSSLNVLPQFILLTFDVSWHFSYSVIFKLFKLFIQLMATLTAITKLMVTLTAISNTSITSVDYFCLVQTISSW